MVRAVVVIVLALAAHAVAASPETLREFCARFDRKKRKCISKRDARCQFLPKSRSCVPDVNHKEEELVGVIELPAPGRTQRVRASATALTGATTDISVLRSSSGQVTVLTDANGAPQARSYDKRAWEVVQGAAADCDANFCKLRASESALASGDLFLSTFEADKLSDAQVNARFLMQASFGPTRQSIRAVGTHGGRFRDWIEEQAALRPTLLREYFRRRANRPLLVESSVGRPSKPCERGSRWHRFAFSVNDVGKALDVVDRGNYLELRVEDVVRHQETDRKALALALEGGSSLRICSVEPHVGGDVLLGEACAVRLANAAIRFVGGRSPEPARTITVPRGGLENLTPAVPDAKLLAAKLDSCDLPAVGPIFAMDDNDSVYLHDARLVMLDNTVQSPAVGSLHESSCPNAPRTFANIDSCVASLGACTPTHFTDAEFDLDEQAVRTFFTVGGKYVYAVTGLPANEIDSPCDYRSRWLVHRGPCASSTRLSRGTRRTIGALLEQSFDEDPNPMLRDVGPPRTGACEREAVKGAFIEISRDREPFCFENVHPDLYNVYDMSAWTLDNAHPGNKRAFEAGRPNPIKKFAELLDSPLLEFPSWHPTSRWTSKLDKHTFLGRLHDRVNFRLLPTEVQTRALGEAFGAAPRSTLGAAEAIGVSCGSPGEVAPDPALGSRFGFAVASNKDANPGKGRLDEPVPEANVQSTVWTMVALTAPDQLRQRVAWALSQILVASSGFTGSEKPVTFYDIFVRHALGNYRDVLREVSYSPVMGRMLSYLNSRSLPSSGTYPDENYAREIMQLFTIGLWKLNLDGTPKKDAATGQSLPTYTNDDILEFARAWTGFERQLLRGNIELHKGDTSANSIDPMRVRGDWRDPFPKLGLDGAYIGDGLPVCEEMPSRGFLRKGAVYRFLGSSPESDLEKDPAGLLEGELALRVELDPATSDLAAALCNAKDRGEGLRGCRLSAETTLDANLPCRGIECDLDTVNVIMLPTNPRRCPNGTLLERHDDDRGHGDMCRAAIFPDGYTCPEGCTRTPFDVRPYCARADDPSKPCRVDPAEHRGFFFEYVRSPCVHLAFFNGGRRIADRQQEHASCADPRSIVAGDACCANSLNAANSCKYSGERLSFATAVSRCKTAYDPQRTPCDYSYVRNACPIDPKRAWSDAPCRVQVKVHPAAGKIAIVHDVGQSPRAANTAARMRPALSRDTVNWFRALWDRPEDYPNAKRNRCAAGACEAVPAPEGAADPHACLCDTVTVEEAVFAALPTVDEALANLHVGSWPPGTFEDDHWALAADRGDVKAFAQRGRVPFDEHTVFRVKHPHKGALWLRNVRSVVRIVGTDLAFRNPPTFHDMDLPRSADALHETEAVLDHYFYHPNTAPFIAKSLIKHLVTSNPGPQYVESVAAAFSKGAHKDLGSGRYGDLLATVAAVLLHPESRNEVLDADPAAGQHRQSMLKLIHTMRALEYEPRAPAAVAVFDQLESKLGIEPLRPPSVFSFYLPEYAPPGQLKRAAMVAPETQLLTTPLVVSMLNGLFSLVKHGLTHCDNGFGLAPPGHDPASSRCSGAQGKLTYSPRGANAEASPDETLDELDLLLTGGRLRGAARDTVLREFKAELRNSGSQASALRVAVQLILASPHFHSTNQCEQAAAPRPGDVRPSNGAHAQSGHKAVIFVNLQGGLDSFNALVPLDKCGRKDLYREYARVRGKTLALEPEELLPIDASGSRQPCSTFGVHHALENVRALYEEGEALFVANAGPLVEPVKGSRPRLPRSLFAHNVQQQCLLTNVPQRAAGPGLLGRLQDELVRAGYSAASFSIAGATDLLETDRGLSPLPDIMSPDGVPHFDPEPASPRLHAAVHALNNATSASLLGEVWASSVSRALERTATLREILRQHELELPFKANGPLGRQLEQVARLIKSRGALGSNRNAFYVSLDGFDTHGDAKKTLRQLLREVDRSVESLVRELRAQGVWKDVVVVFASEFGRSLVGNGAGSDHGWGGNYWLLGGGLAGKRILGTYPSELHEAAERDRGRIVPTTSWDAVWNSVAEWLGVPDAASLDAVLPNRGNFDEVWRASDLFEHTDR